MKPYQFDHITKIIVTCQSIISTGSEFALNDTCMAFKVVKIPNLNHFRDKIPNSKGRGTALLFMLIC